MQANSEEVGGKSKGWIIVSCLLFLETIKDNQLTIGGRYLIGFNAIALSPSRKTAWLVGAKGKVAKVDLGF